MWVPEPSHREDDSALEAGFGRPIDPLTHWHSIVGAGGGPSHLARRFDGHALPRRLAPLGTPETLPCVTKGRTFTSTRVDPREGAVGNDRPTLPRSTRTVGSAWPPRPGAQHGLTPIDESEEDVRAIGGGIVSSRGTAERPQLQDRDRARKKLSAWIVRRGVEMRSGWVWAAVMSGIAGGIVGCGASSSGPKAPAFDPKD